MTADDVWFIFLLAMIAVVRVAWLGWILRYRSPLDIVNDDLARARARRRR